MITKMEVFSPHLSAPKLQLGGYMPNSDPVQILDIQGLGPVKAEVASTAFASGRGELHQGSTTGKRNIVLTLGLNPNWQNQTMATLRQMLYSYFMTEQWTKLRFFSDHLPTVDIEGIVESFEPNIFSKDPEIQVSVLCHKPDFIEVDATILSGFVDDGSIKVEFRYNGQINTGFELLVQASPGKPTYTGSFLVVLRSPTIPQAFEINPVTVDTTKYFKLSTLRNAKRAQNIGVDDGVTTNLLSGMNKLSSWPEIKVGKNDFSIAASEPGQVWTLAYFNRYGGL